MKFRTGFAVFGLACLACAFAQQNEKVGKKRPDPFAPMPPQAWIMQVHSSIRSALEDLSSTDFRTMKVKDESGNIKTVKIPPSFGVNRVPLLSILHDNVIRETKIPMFQPVKKFEVEYYALSNHGKPLDQGELQMHKDFGFYGVRIKGKRKSEVIAFGTKALNNFSNTADMVQGKIGEDEAEAMPLRATRKACIKCHSDSKVGDQLAVVVYVIRKIQ